MNLLEFARWAIENGAWEGCDLYGGDIQEKAEACGIIVKTKYDPAIHGQNDADPGDEWYVYSDEFNAARKRNADAG